ncbi:hypothetical protein Droror1_Dr00027842 [Drosera rotundifolia]
MMGNIPLKSGTVLAKDLLAHHGQLTENIEATKSNPKKKTYLRMINFYLNKLGKLPKEDGVPFPSNKYISFRRKESDGTEGTSKARPFDGQHTSKRKKTSDAGAPQKKQKRSSQPE